MTASCCLWYRTVSGASPLLCPLLSHSVSDIWERLASQDATSLPCSLVCWAIPFSTAHDVHRLHNIRELQQRQTFQPKTRFLAFGVAEMVRLYDLVGLPVYGGHDPNRVFDCNARAGRVCEGKKKLYCLLLPSICSFCRKMSCATHCQMSTWRKSNYHVPFLVQQRQNVLLQVIFRMSARTWQNIATKRLVPSISQAIRYRLTFFACYKYFHFNA